MNHDNKKTKALEDLNLLDRFLFAEAMEDAIICKNMLELILGKPIELVQTPHTEKEFRTAPDKRSIRVDIYAMDTEQNVYDTEVQRENTKNLPRRSRFYQALVDRSLLEPGTRDFNELNAVYIILITPFDLFGQGRYQYTFRMKCEEDRNLDLMDGGTRIFLNTRGINREGVRPELIDFLDYVEKGAQKGLPQNSDPRLQEIDSRVHHIKSRKEVGVRYMHFWLENELELQEAKRKMREELREEIQKEVRAEVQGELQEEVREAEEQTLKSIVKNMLSQSLPVEMIQSITGCEKKQIEAWGAEHLKEV